MQWADEEAWSDNVQLPRKSDRTLVVCSKEAAKNENLNSAITAAESPPSLLSKDAPQRMPKTPR